MEGAYLHAYVSAALLLGMGIELVALLAVQERAGWQEMSATLIAGSQAQL